MEAFSLLFLSHSSTVQALSITVIVRDGVRACVCGLKRLPFLFASCHKGPPICCPLPLSHGSSGKEMKLKMKPCASGSCCCVSRCAPISITLFMRRSLFLISRESIPAAGPPFPFFNARNTFSAVIKENVKICLFSPKKTPNSSTSFVCKQNKIKQLLELFEV